VALWGLGVHVVLGVVALLVALWTKTEDAPAMLSPQYAGWVLLAGVPVWFLCLLHVRQKRLADEEAVDWERLMKERESAGGRGALFEVEEGEAFLMRHRLRSFERIWLPVASLFIVAILGVLFFLLVWRGVLGVKVAQVEQSLNYGKILLAVCFLLVEAFAAFLLGMFAAGMAKEAVWRDIRPGASYMMFGAACLGLAIVGFVASWFRFYVVELIVCWLIAVSFALIAAETLLNFIINRYRPRTPGTEVRFAYDSRLLELVTSPGSLLSTAASTLDYQFGFKVSDTWFYRFMERMIAPIILFDLLALYVLSCVVIVDTSERAVVERFGSPFTRAGQLRLLGPGLHLKYPWPVDKAYRVPVRQAHALVIGRGREVEGVTDWLWTQEHFEDEYKVLVATEVTEREEENEKDRPPPVNFLATTLSLHYRVRDDAESIRNYVYRVSDVERLLKSIAYRELTKYMASVDFYDAMCTQRHAVGEELRRRIQNAPDIRDLGIEVFFAGIQGIHPPVEDGVGEAFERVVAAQEEKEATILKAQAYAVEQVRLAEFDARRLIVQAQGEAVEREILARADAERFEKQLALYRLAPRIFRLWHFFDAALEGLRKCRKYVVLAEDYDHLVTIIDVTQTKAPSLLRVGKIGEEEEESEKEGAESAEETR